MAAGQRSSCREGQFTKSKAASEVELGSVVAEDLRACGLFLGKMARPVRAWRQTK